MQKRDSLCRHHECRRLSKLCLRIIILACIISASKCVTPNVRQRDPRIILYQASLKSSEVRYSSYCITKKLNVRTASNQTRMYLIKQDDKEPESQARGSGDPCFFQNFIKNKKRERACSGHRF